MEYQSTTQVTAEKSERYMNSLAKHFARKVPVDFNEQEIIVRFEIGNCRMTTQDTEMHFECSAVNTEKLAVVKDVVGSHIVKYGELKDAKIVWSDTP